MYYLKNLIFIFLLSSLMMGCNAQADQNKGGDNKKEDKDKIGKKNKEPASSAVTIETKWDMPPILKEVSGIGYMGNNQFACVQDEAGAIFIYNTGTEKIIRQINFGASGDYEGIALVGPNAYIVRSDGLIFEILDFESDAKKIKEFQTALTAKNNVEGIAYDQKNNRLLMSIKGEEAGQQDFKGIYAFDLNSKTLVKEPIVKLRLDDAELQNYKGKNQQNAVQPSEIAINPVTQEIYLADSPNSQLLILDDAGAIKARYKLKGSEFSQPEGLAFSPAGELYIANEGKKETGNIMKVKIGDE